MTKIPWFSTFSGILADSAYVDMPSSTIWVAFWTFSVGVPTFLANPLWILLLFKDGIVVVTILVPVGPTVS
jgi:hypothetical protein